MESWRLLAFLFCVYVVGLADGLSLVDGAEVVRVILRTVVLFWAGWLFSVLLARQE